MHREIEYLDHIIETGELKVAKKTITAIQGFAPPKTRTEIKSFLGMCNVYRRFIKELATISDPLNALLRKDAPDNFELRQNQIDSFNNLRQKLTSPPVLSIPKPGLPYILDKDGNEFQVSCMLQQQYPDNSLHSIGFSSRT